MSNVARLAWAGKHWRQEMRNLLKPSVLVTVGVLLLAFFLSGAGDAVGAALMALNAGLLGSDGGVYVFLNILMIAAEGILAVLLLAALVSLLGTFLRRMWRRSKLSVATNVLTVLFILFVCSIPLLGRAIGEAGVARLDAWIWAVLLGYICVQLVETMQRSSADMGQFAMDNLLALVALVLIAILMAVQWRYLGGGERDILVKCLGYGLVDLLFGVGFSQRISFSGKERDETERKV